MLQARELVLEVMGENPSIMQIHGHQLTLIADGLCTFTDNRENYATTQVGLDIIISEDGITWNSCVPTNLESDEDQEKWLDDIVMAMPDDYFNKYFTSKKKHK